MQLNVTGIETLVLEDPRGICQDLTDSLPPRLQHPPPILPSPPRLQQPPRIRCSTTPRWGGELLNPKWRQGLAPTWQTDLDQRRQPNPKGQAE